MRRLTMGLLLAALLAQVQTAQAQPEPQPAPAPDDLAARIAGADHQSADAIVVLDHSTVFVEPNGQSHTFRRQVVKVLTEQGAAALSRLRFDYDPATMQVELRSIRIHRSAGEPLEVDTATAQDVPQPGRWIYWGLRNIVLSVPRPQVGDAVEMLVYRTGFQIAYLDESQDSERFVPPMRGHFYDIVLFGDSQWPTVERRYEVTTPRDKPLQFEVYNGSIQASSTFDEQGFHYGFWANDLPAYHREPGAPYASDALPKAVMATVPNWPAKSRWFFHVNEGQFGANDEIRAQVTQITRGLSDDEARVTALTRWVARYIRYRGLSMGEGEGYTLHPGTMVFAHRAGVCKDIASMLLTMMRAAGFTVYPAMTMAGARVETIAADQFNHSVVAWQQDDGSFRMLDPTWAPMSRQLWSNAEREQHYLIGTEEGEELTQTTPQGPEHNFFMVKGRGSIDATGNVSSTVSISAKGYLEDRFRRLFGFGPALETGPIVSKMARAIAPNAEVTRFGMDDHLNLNQPFGVRFQYGAKSYGQVAGPFIRLPAVPLGHNVLVHPRLSQHLEVTGSAKRTQPLLLRCAMTIGAEEQLRLPRGYQLVAPIQREIRNGAGSFRATIEQQGQNLMMTMSLVINRRRFSAGEYSQVRALANGQRALAATPIVLRREEAN